MITRIGVNHLVILAWILAVAEMIQAAPPAATDSPPQEGDEETQCDNNR